MPTPQELHNELAGPMVRSIITPVVQAGGNYTDVLVLLETVVAGVLLFVSREEAGDGLLCDALNDAVKIRLRELRQKKAELDAAKLNETAKETKPIK